MRCISYIYYYIFHDGVGVLCYLMRLQPRIIPLKNLLTIQDLYHRLQCYINLSTLSVHLSFGGLYLHTVPVQCTSIIWRALAIYIHLLFEGLYLYTVQLSLEDFICIYTCISHLEYSICIYPSFGGLIICVHSSFGGIYLNTILIWRSLSV